mgnify:CR=1 FL=1
MTEELTVTREEALQAAETYRKARLEEENILSRIKSEQAAIAAKYEDKVLILGEVQEECCTRLKRYIDENGTLLNGKRSLDFAGLTIGYRKAAAKLVLVGKTTWEKVCDLLLATEEWKEAYIKTKHEADKNALKKADAKMLKSIGLKIEQDDNFFVNL